MNYQEALSYIHSVSWLGSKPGLDRITELCRRIGNPQDSLRFIHVAGTNGKGSFCAMLESILRASGYETGLFTSPYIEHFRERMQVSGKPITDEELADITSYIKPHAEAMEDTPTEFELVTAISFLYFKRKGCRIVILETGMGGRLDSTNVIHPPIMSVITGIAADHTEYLGDTLEQIASEKAGIIKPGSIVLYGGEEESIQAIIEKKAADEGCSFHCVDQTALSNVCLTIDGTSFDYGTYKNLHIQLRGDYQLINAAKVITAADILRKGGVKITDDSLRIGLANAKWKGRFEVLAKNPDVIFDGAHNIEGMQHALSSMQGYYPGKKIAIVMGVMKDKEYDQMVKMLAPVCDRAFTATPANPRALCSEELAKTFANYGIYATAFASFETAAKEAYQYAVKQNIPLFCLGSLYSYAAFKQTIDQLTHH
ncbi:MAG: bifunctional folylpolyglutamate synthase/dihydrofolate synthase [Clostridiales bacterium]|nr:bifunctional folylpolyglutamate synthase/dihydrofolate synthase [Clostridiales bacterium]